MSNIDTAMLQSWVSGGLLGLALLNFTIGNYYIVPGCVVISIMNLESALRNRREAQKVLEENSK
jgi:hypothetical protein